MTALPESERTVRALLAEKKVIVCCGAGGVGKTTTAAALGIAGARLGRRVLVLTVDPSLRLAEALGVARNPPKPVPLSAEHRAQAQISGSGSLEVWMLDAKAVAESTVRRLSSDEATLQKVLSNRLYQEVTSIVAGMHEYAAMAALHRFLSEGRYDLVVLDTPPSRNALDFLEAPGRVAQFLEGRIFKLFVAKEGGFFRRASTKLVSSVLPRVLGEDFAAELTVFLGSFSGLFSAVSSELSAMRKMLSQPDVAFLLVTSPAEAAVTEAHFFQDKMRQLNLPLAGFVLNRATSADGKTFPTDFQVPPDASPHLASALEKLKPLARLETLQAVRDQGLLAELALRVGEHGFAMGIPALYATGEPLLTLTAVADRLLSERRSGPRLTT